MRYLVAHSETVSHFIFTTGKIREIVGSLAKEQMMYKTINGWTKKSMVEHIKKEFKGKSVSETSLRSDGAPSCLYRGSDGKKCAVGMFIPDDLYNKNMENLNAAHPGLATIRSKMPLEIDSMSCLQDCHDDSEPDNTLSDMLTWIDKHVEA